ncbi:MAG: hypothetical protein K2N00_13040 [Lachnospiraceae bacterium]|nr:hypothetical protein [Lachnospiraceae bacterium]
MILLSKIAAEAVPERTYFLSGLENPFVINGIRIVGIVVLIFFVGSYLKYRKKINGNYEAKK